MEQFETNRCTLLRTREWGQQPISIIRRKNLHHGVRSKQATAKLIASKSVYHTNSTQNNGSNRTRLDKNHEKKLNKTVSIQPHNTIDDPFERKLENEEEMRELY